LAGGNRDDLTQRIQFEGLSQKRPTQAAATLPGHQPLRGVAEIGVDAIENVRIGGKAWACRTRDEIDVDEVMPGRVDRGTPNFGSVSIVRADRPEAAGH